MVHLIQCIRFYSWSDRPTGITLRFCTPLARPALLAAWLACIQCNVCDGQTDGRGVGGMRCMSVQWAVAVMMMRWWTIEKSLFSTAAPGLFYVQFLTVIIYFPRPSWPNQPDHLTTLTHQQGMGPDNYGLVRLS